MYCDSGKMCFDKKTAQTKRNQLLKGKGKHRRSKDVEDLRIYHCEECNFFHLTKLKTWN